MKKVFSDYESVAHLWANQSQDEAEKKNHGLSQMFFRGKSIYSYGHHFCIATLHEKYGKTSVLLTNRKNSHTTNEQINVVRAASSQFDRVVCAYPGGGYTIEHEKNIADWEFKAECLSAKLAKSVKPSIYLDQIAALRHEMDVYVKYFGCSDLTKDLIYIYLNNKADGKEANEKRQAFRLKQEQEREARRLEDEKIRALRFKKNLLRWRRNGKDRLYSDNFSYLRINKALNIIETSQRVELPIAYMKKHLPRLLRLCDRGYMHNSVNIQKVLEWAVIEATPEFIRVGCHKVEVSEMKRLQKSLTAYPFIA